MIKYPLHFEASATGPSGIETRWSTQVTGHDPLTAAVPPEFEGPGGGYSPEDFYALAMMNCFIATYKVFAAKSGALFGTISARARLTVDRNAQGTPWMAAIDLHITVTGAENPERIQRILEKTSKSCLVHNSVKTEVRFEFHVA